MLAGSRPRRTRVAESVAEVGEPVPVR